MVELVKVEELVKDMVIEVPDGRSMIVKRVEPGRNWKGEPIEGVVDVTGEWVAAETVMLFGGRISLAGCEWTFPMGTEVEARFTNRAAK